MADNERQDAESVRRIKLRYRLRQWLRCSYLSHFFNREPSLTCWLCRLHFPPRRLPLREDRS